MGKKENKELKQNSNNIFQLILALLLIVIIGAGIYGFRVVRRERGLYNKYQQAFELYKKGSYDESEKILKTISSYEGVSELLTDIRYRQGLLAYEAGDYANARELFFKVSNYQDSLDYIEEITYLLGLEAYSVQDYDAAKSYFEEIPEYKEAPTYLEELTFLRLQRVFQSGFYMEAEECIFEIPEYPGVEPYAIVVLEEQGKAAYEAQQYERSIEMFRMALEYSSWMDIYNLMPEEEKAVYGAIAGEVDFVKRLKNIKEEKALAEREYQAVLCLKELVKYYENNKIDVAVLSQVDEIRFALQTYTNEAVIPLIMIAFQETVKENKQQAYAAYNETDLYGICHSLKMEELDKSNSEELQTYLKISELWEDKSTVKIDMVRIRKAMGWE